MPESRKLVLLGFESAIVAVDLNCGVNKIIGSGFIMTEHQRNQKLSIKDPEKEPVVFFSLFIGGRYNFKLND